MSTPKISVIAPVYKVEKYLHRCIDSILVQTFTDFELLLINDGSPDNCGAICDKYAAKDARIRVFHKENGGVSTARNLGLDNAKGEWITFIDSDDWVDDSFLSNYMEEVSDITFQGYRKMDGNRIEIVKKMPYMHAKSRLEIENILCKIFEYGNYLGPTWNKVFKNSIIQRFNIRFLEEVSIREDEVFTFNYCKHINSITILPTTNYNYMHYPDSLMHKPYKNPHELIVAFENSFQESMQIASQKYFIFLLEKYYINSLIWACKMMYYPGKLLTKEERIKILRKTYTIIKKRDKEENKYKQKFFVGNVGTTDFLYLTKHYTISKIKSYLRK